MSHERRHFKTIAYMHGVSDGLRHPHFGVPFYYEGTPAEDEWRRGNAYARRQLIGVRTKTHPK